MRTCPSLNPTFLLVLILFMALLPACGEDTAQMRLPIVYDDFSLGAIDTSKWMIDTSGGGLLYVSDGKAVHSVNTSTGDMRSRLEFPPAVAKNIRTVTARIRPLSYFEGGGSNVRFRISAWVYKDDALVGADETSDIFSQLRIRGGQFQAIVSRCTDATCGTSTIFLGPTVLGSVTLGQTYDMSLTWNGGTGFIHSVSGVGSTSFDASVGGTFTKIGSAFVPRALVEVNASSGAPTTGTMTTEVDYVICLNTGLGPC